TDGDTCETQIIRHTFLNRKVITSYSKDKITFCVCVVIIWYGGRWFCLVVDNAIAKDLLSHPDIFPKLMLDEHFPNSLIARYYGVNVVHSNGSVWRRYRFTLDVLGKAAFAIDFNNLEDPNNVYVTAYNKVQEDIQNPYFIYFPILNYIPFLNKQRFKRVEELDNKFNKIIEQKREALVNGNTENNRKDLLDLMLKACEDPENQNLSNTELRHNLGVFMLAGHDTTASSLATILYLLAAHKDVQQKAREEILTVLGDDLTPSAEQHKSLKYLNMIIYENLRLYPPIAILPARVTTKDIECCGNVIPTGALRKYEISLTPNSIHKDGLKIDVAYSGTMSPLPVELVFKRRNE
ncbi:21442_t:CDS:10, partial [Gigaspora rosea]